MCMHIVNKTCYTSPFARVILAQLRAMLIFSDIAFQFIAYRRESDKLRARHVRVLEAQFDGKS